MVLIQDSPGAVERALTLHGAECRLMDKIEAQWGERCRSHAIPRGIPDGWLQAMIYRESEGDPKAYRKEPPRKDGTFWTGIGLLQITHPSLKGRKYDWDTKKWIGGLTDEQVFDPDTNIGIAAKYIRGFINVHGNDFPRVAASFNAGSARPPMNKEHENPWWLHSTGNHISVEVAALNYWITAYGGSVTENPPLISLVDLAREEDEKARKDTLPPEGAA